MNNLTAPALVAQLLHFHVPQITIAARPPSSQRFRTVAELANLVPYPELVPINHLVKVVGTPLAEQPDLAPLEFVRIFSVARITMPRTRVRLSAGRQSMSEAVQALCFVAGANSIFYGGKLLTNANPDVDADGAMLQRHGLHTGHPMPRDLKPEP